MSAETNETTEPVNVIVYTKDRCPQCNVTKTRMNSKGIKYTLINITNDEAKIEELREAGFRAMPVVIAGDDSWAGFQPRKIDALVSSTS